MKLLVIRFSSIGDIVLTSPVLRCLKEQIPSIEVHFLTKTSFSSIVESNPNVDKVHVLGKSFNEVMKTLEQENFDEVIDLHHNLRSLRVKKALGKPSHSFNKLNVEKWLMTRFKVDKLPELHIVDRYMETVKHLKVKNDNQGLDFFISPEDEVNLTSFSKKLSGSFIVFAIGAAHQTKRLPIEKIGSICRSIEQTIVIIGGKAEVNDGEFLEKDNTHVINLCGRLTIGQSASFIKQSEAVITHDTGMMHIAAAFQKRIISIWGNTIPKFGMYPYLPEHEELSSYVEVNDLACRPCSKIGHDSCPKEHFKCMNNIDEQQVAKLLKD